MIIAIDIGGTKTLVASLDPKGNMLSEEKFATSHDTHEFIQDLKQILDRFNKEDMTVISIASAGLIDLERSVVVYSPNLSWDNFALVDALRQDYSCPILLQNDANAAATAVVRELEQTPPLALYIAVGTGVGTSLVFHGEIDHALSRSEGGHMMFQTEDGLHDWESLASGRAIKRQFGKRAVDITDPKDWEIIASHLALGLRALIPALQPDIVIFGGGVGPCFNRFAAPLQKLLREQIPAYIPIPTFIPATDPEKAVIRGCYYHAVDTLKPAHTPTAAS